MSISRATGVPAGILLGSLPVAAQTITGVPGSASSTITLDGKQLPPPPQKFGGVIKESAKDSKPFWPARVVKVAAPIANKMFECGMIP